MAKITKVNVADVWKSLHATTPIKVKVAGAWKTVTGVGVKDNGIWNEVFGTITPSSGALAVAAIPAVNTGRVGAGMCLSDVATAVPSGGTAPYTYVWTKVSGTTLEMSAATAVSTRFAGAVPKNGNITSTYRVTVTDAVLTTASADVAITLSGSNANPACDFISSGAFITNAQSLNLSGAQIGDLAVVFLNAILPASMTGTGSGSWNTIVVGGRYSVKYRTLTAADIASPPGVDVANEYHCTHYAILRGPIAAQFTVSATNFGLVANNLAGFVHDTDTSAFICHCFADGAGGTGGTGTINHPTSNFTQRNHVGGPNPAAPTQQGQSAINTAIDITFYVDNAAIGITGSVGGPGGIGWYSFLFEMLNA